MQKPKIILCTGIDGKVNREKINKIIEASSYSSKVKIYNVGDYMKAAAHNDYPTISKENLLDPRKESESQKYREIACQKIKNAIRKQKPEVAIVHTRAEYYDGNISRDYQVMDESHNCLKPDFCINVIDDIQIMHKNMKSDSGWRNITLDKLIDWRAKELETTESYWGKKSNIITYLLPVQEPPGTLIDLLFSKKKKAYLSFPISLRLEKQKFEERKTDFLEKLRKHFIVFDPFSIQEYDKRDSYTKNKSLITKIGHKTVFGDFKLISQCDFIVVYYPTEEIYVKITEEIYAEITKDPYDKDQETVGTLKLKSGKETYVKRDKGITLSAGVINEMVHADDLKKPIYALWFSKKPPSPFFSFHCDRYGGKLFPSPKAEEDFFKYVGKIKSR